MARKSRRTLDEQPKEVKVQGQEIYPTAIYARLSVENSGKDDNGAAIENQIEICREYIAECPDLNLVKVYQDNGWTGTVMRRPAFDELMEDVRNGIIKAVVVRDLSRFARNYIEMGNYLEKVLPELEVRFISVKERFDTAKVDGSNESLMIPLQNLINDLYSRDISRKVETVIHTQMEEGTFIWRKIPYGYRWNEDHSNIVPDEATAPVVRKIYEWKAEGTSWNGILTKLNETYPPEKNGKKTDHWEKSSVRKILQNPSYIGKRVYGCRHSAIYKGIKSEKVPEEDWYVIEHAHEALVMEETFDLVQKQFAENSSKRQESMKNTEKDRAKLVDILNNKIFCAECGYRMYFKRSRRDCKDHHWYSGYFCSSNRIRKELGCVYNFNQQETVNEKVLEAIRIQLKLALDYEKVIEKMRNSEEERAIRRRLDSGIQSVSLRLNQVQQKRKKLYEDYTDGILDETEYMYAKAEYEKQHEVLSRQHEELVSKREAYREAISPQNKWIRMMKKAKRARKLTQELVDVLVEKVRVFKGGDIEVIFHYQDIFDLTKAYLEEMGGKKVG